MDGLSGVVLWGGLCSSMGWCGFMGRLCVALWGRCSFMGRDLLARFLCVYRLSESLSIIIIFCYYACFCYRVVYGVLFLYCKRLIFSVKVFVLTELRPGHLIL